MTTITKSVHSCLQLIKKHKKRAETLRGSLAVATVQGESQKPTNKSYKTKEELQAALQSNYDSLTSSLDIVASIKEKIAESNLKTTVNYLGKDVSITKVLAIKETLNERKLRLGYVRKQIRDAEEFVDTRNTKEQATITATEDSEQRNAREQQYIKFTELSIITYSDTKSPAQLLEEAAKEVEVLEYEIDTILSESNIATLIELPMNFVE